jgi:hypothetical protein
MVRRTATHRLTRQVGIVAIRMGALAGLVGCAACQTAPIPDSGFLASYEGLDGSRQGSRGPHERRDDAASDAIARVYVQPTVLALAADTTLSVEDQALVRHEVDRQVCYEVSKRFILEPVASPQAGTIRTVIVRITPTGRIGSAVSAAAGFFIPVPVVKFRTPMTTGGLALESELLAPGGYQVAAITWSKNAEVVGRRAPSLSRVGDALQLAKPFGGAVRDAFSSKTRPARPIAKPDPCARFGPRRSVGRIIASGLVSAGTGLYVPEVTGAAARTQEAGERPRD